MNKRISVRFAELLANGEAAYKSGDKTKFRAWVAKAAQTINSHFEPMPGSAWSREYCEFVDSAETPEEKISVIEAIVSSLEDSIVEDTVIQAIDPKLVFVVMPFSDDMEPIFEGIKSAGDKLGLTVQRVKDVRGDYRITDKMIEMIRTARFIVVDLTQARPNVYFELGFARGLGKSVTTIAREGTEIHFDVKDWRYISYNDSRAVERKLFEEWREQLKP